LWKWLNIKGTPKPPGVKRSWFPNSLSKKALLVSGVDYEPIKLLILSIVWRMSVASRPEFSGVDLGAHEDRIRLMLLGGQAGAAEDYPVILVRLLEEFRGIHISPSFIDIGSCEILRLNLTRTSVHFLQTDQGHLCSSRGLFLAPNRDLRMPLVQSADLHEFKELRRVVNEFDPPTQS